MASDLTRAQFVSLLMVGDAGLNDLTPYIPTDHETRLVELGYVTRLEGRLRMTTPGKQRISPPQPEEVPQNDAAMLRPPSLWIG